MITLYVDNGTAYVWNSEDWHILRSEHRICGALLGSMPAFPRQNDFLGLPMALMSEEAAVLVENGICKLIELQNIKKKPSDEEKEIFLSLEKNGLSQQIEALRKRKIEQISEKIDLIVSGKTKKLMSKGISDIQLNKEELLNKEISKIPPLSPAHYLVHLPMESSMNEETKEVDINVLKPSIIEGDGVIKYKVFKSLWDNGSYITYGSKFGSDYLVYPGDPVKFHATYMVKCIYDHEALLHSTTIVALGRLAVAVNKIIVLGYCNVNGNVEFQTLQWHNTVTL